MSWLQTVEARLSHNLRYGLYVFLLLAIAIPACKNGDDQQTFTHIHCSEACVAELEQQGRKVTSVVFKYTKDFDDQRPDGFIYKRAGDSEERGLGEVPPKGQKLSHQERFSELLIDAQNHCKKVRVCILFSDDHAVSRLETIRALPPNKECCPEKQ